MIEIIILLSVTVLACLVLCAILAVKNRALGKALSQQSLREDNDLKKRETISMRERLRIALEASKSGVWDIDVPNRRIYFDANFKALIQYENGNSMSLSELAEHLTPYMDKSKYVKFYDFLLLPECSQSGIADEVTLNFADGPRHIKNNYKVIYRGGVLWHLTGMAMDVTDSKNMTHELELAQSRLELALDSADVGVWEVFLEDGEFRMYYEKNFAKLFRIGHMRPFATPAWADYLTSIMDNEIYKGFFDFLRNFTFNFDCSRVVQNAELHFADGTVTYIKNSAKLSYNEDGSPRSMVGMCVDISDIRRVEKDIVEAKEAAEQANKAKSRFLSNMSHEIRTPMNAIVGMTAIALKEDLPKPARRCLEKISSASRVLLSLLNNILDMSKIEADKLELAEHTFELSDILERIRAIVMVQACEKGQRLNIAVNPDVPERYYGDSLRLTQVLSNILYNAVKFSGNNSEINLVIERTSASGQSVELTFRVSDQGIGISDEQLDRLFSPFEQGDNQIVLKYGGTGLGLALSKKIVEKMGGRFVVSSELGKGSVFSFNVQLQLADASYADLPKKADEVGIDGKLEGKTIMLVDDVDINRDIINALLDGSGARIVEAQNGLEAVELFKSGLDQYDLILMDVQMPVMDGYQASRAIRAISSSLPIIAMTANAFKEDMELSLQAGMNAHISKPVDEKKLFEKLLKYI